LWGQVLPGITIVSHVWGLTMGAVFRIVCDARKIKLPEVEIETLENVFLAVFVAMAVCTMQLWQIIDLALPLVAILAVNTVFTFLFVIFVTYPLCGRNYDSACIASGQYGFGMGAAISSMANLGELSQKYTMSKLAYFIVPLVGALFSNYTNAVIINVFMTIFR
jgi:ESS family glutamate:Na+ symporter